MQLLISLIICIVCYLLFKRFGLKGGYIFILLLVFGYLYYNKALDGLYNLGLSYLLVFILSTLLIQFIITAIMYRIFDRVPLIVYLFMATAIEYFNKFLIIFMIGYVSGLNLKFDNAPSFKEQTRYITSTMNLNIDLINIGADSKMISLDYACSNPNIIKDIVTTSDIEFSCEPYIGEYKFILKGINRYDGNIAQITCSSSCK